MVRLPAARHCTEPVERTPLQREIAVLIGAVAWYVLAVALGLAALGAYFGIPIWSCL